MASVLVLNGATERGDRLSNQCFSLGGNQKWSRPHLEESSPEAFGRIQAL